jgi:hypothetical protein
MKTIRPYEMPHKDDLVRIDLGDGNPVTMKVISEPQPSGDGSWNFELAEFPGVFNLD